LGRRVQGRTALGGDRPAGLPDARAQFLAVIGDAGSDPVRLSIVEYILRSLDLFSTTTYLFLWLLGGGVLLLTWPTRTDRRGRFAFAMAIMVSTVCALWAAALYAHNLGMQTAKKDVRDLSTHTAVAVYSTDRLALSGPGVTIQILPAAYHYHYVYRGLRLLLAQSGTYYLLPVDWSPQHDLTYILDQGDPIRIELGGG